MGRVSPRFVRTGIRVALIGGSVAVAAAVAAMIVTASGATERIPRAGVLAPEPVTPPVRTLLSTAPVERHEPEGILTFRVEHELAAVRFGDAKTRVDTPTAEVPDRPSADTATEAYPSPDGRFTAVVGRDQDGTRLDVRSRGELRFSLALAGPSDPELRGAKALAAAIEGIPLVVAWSPDSSRLAVGSIAGAPWTLNVIGTRSWYVDRHELLGGYVGELAWSPDGESLAISTYELDGSDHNVLILDSAARSMHHLLRGCTIVWSPDSGYLAVRREPRDVPGLWIASIDGTTLTRITEEEASFPVSWTPASSVSR